jgi:hypothetical protein
VLTGEKQLQLYVNGKLAASGESPALVPTDPAQALEIGGDDAGAVGDCQSPSQFIGTIDEFRLYQGELTPAEIASLASPVPSSRDVHPASARLNLFCSFDDGTANDASGNQNHGKVGGKRTTEGKIGTALRFQGGAGGSAGSFVKRYWAQDVSLMVRAMVKANDVLFIAGPPDLIDEEETFQKIVDRDREVEAQLAQQNDALDGKLGGSLLAVSAADGSTLSQFHLDSLPVWDGMAAANGKLYLSTVNGDVLCFGESQ